MIVFWKYVVNHAEISLQPSHNNSTRHPVRPLNCNSPIALPPLTSEHKVHFRDHHLPKIFSSSSFSVAEASRTTEEPSHNAMHWTVRHLVSLWVSSGARGSHSVSCQSGKLRSALSRPRSTEALQYYHKDVPMWTAEEKSGLLFSVARLVWHPYQYGASSEGTCQRPREGPESLSLRVSSITDTQLLRMHSGSGSYSLRTHAYFDSTGNLPARSTVIRCWLNQSDCLLFLSPLVFCHVLSQLW